MSRRTWLPMIIGLGVIGGLSSVAVLRLWCKMPPEFSEKGIDRMGRSTWRFAATSDHCGNSFAFDEARNALFIVPAVDHRRGLHGRSSKDGILLGCEPGNDEQLLSHINHTLFICAADGEIHRFPLPGDVAMTVVAAVKEDHCDDVRELLLQLCDAPDVDVLRELLYPERLREMPAASKPTVPEP